MYHILEKHSEIAIFKNNYEVLCESQIRLVDLNFKDLITVSC